MKKLVFWYTYYRTVFQPELIYYMQQPYTRVRSYIMHSLEIKKTADKSWGEDQACFICLQAEEDIISTGLEL